MSRNIILQGDLLEDALEAHLRSLSLINDDEYVQGIFIRNEMNVADIRTEEENG